MTGAYPAHDEGFTSSSARARLPLAARAAGISSSRRQRNFTSRWCRATFMARSCSSFDESRSSSSWVATAPSLLNLFAATRPGEEPRRHDTHHDVGADVRELERV